MDTNEKNIILSFITFFLINGILFFPTKSIAKDKIAIITKTKGSAELRSNGEKNFSKIKPATILFNKDYIKTGADGYISLVYLDDKSQLKIRQNTNMEILGTRTNDGISKSIDMTAGTMKVQISKNRKGSFIISTPTSVASVKGTVFYFISNALTGDQVIGIEGIVELKNLISGEIIRVLANQTGASLLNGAMELRITQPSDIPEFEDEEETEIKELKIKLNNTEGEEKDLIIKYR